MLGSKKRLKLQRDRMHYVWSTYTSVAIYLVTRKGKKNTNRYRDKNVPTEIILIVIVRVLGGYYHLILK